jgi:outer membrane protein OmpA-like peptidoglycan-associated protein
MHIDRRFAFCAITLLLSACSGTSVVLMPDDNGKVGKVSVQTQAGERELNQAQQGSQAKTADEAPEPPKQLTREEIRAKFADVLAVQPESPEHFNLQKFVSGSADFHPEHHEKLDEIRAHIAKRKSCDIVVIGHCDTVGTNADNEQMSKTRAINVKQALIERGVPEKCIGNIRFYGENDLFEHTEDNVDNAQNRRVEVEIR